MRARIRHGSVQPRERTDSEEEPTPELRDLLCYITAARSENTAVRLEMHHARFWLRLFEAHAPHLFEVAVAKGVDPDATGAVEHQKVKSCHGAPTGRCDFHRQRA